jgi:hypothetical protein
VAHKAICPICNKRRAERYCPAKGEKICAVDCGTEREVTIDCPRDCPYLIAAYRWELAHLKPIPESEIPFPDVSVSREQVQTRNATFYGLGYMIVSYASEQRLLTDAEVFDAVESLATTYRTLISGIYYENPPSGALAAGLYATLAKLLQEEKKTEANQAGSTGLKDSEIFHLLVFLLRFARLRSNGRPRSRAFIEFLRAEYPATAEPATEERRIILP